MTFLVFISDLSWERLVFSIALFVPFSKPCSQTALETEGAKDNVLIKGENIYAAVFVSSKSVISHNNTAHPLLGQNKTKQNKTNKRK